MGRLPNDVFDPERSRGVRTHLIASGEKENALLAKLLLLKTDSSAITPTISRG